MKKIYLIIGGGVVLTLIIAFWVYSFLYGSPTNTPNTLFTNLGIFGNEAVPTEIVPETPTEIPVVDVTTEKLRQLTTKPVIGARDVTVNEVTFMRYVEAGTGHVFDINMTTGQEVRVSQISVPLASEAAISPSGEYIAIRSGNGNQNSVSIISIIGGVNPTETVLPNQVESMAFGYNNEFLFSEVSGGQTELKGYTVSSGATRRISSAPFTSTAVSWSQSSNTPHIIYTKPAASLMGYAYAVTSSGLARLPFSGNGLSVSSSNRVWIFSRNENQTYKTTFISKSTGVSEKAPIDVLPTKCTAAIDGNNTFYCGATINNQLNNMPDQWYKGDISFTDNLWEIKPGKASLLVDPLLTTGRTIDIFNPRLTSDKSGIYFVNKIDKTLWSYDL